MLSLPDPTSHYRVADWVELTVAVTRKSVSRSSIARVLEANGKDAEESFLADVWNNLKSRHELYHPQRFNIDEISVDALKKPPSCAEYLACLLLSLYGAYESTPTKLFERMTHCVLMKYLPARAMVFGWPFTKRRGRNPDEKTLLEEMIRSFAQSSHERFVERPSTRFKDRGVDVIGWVPFPDGRSGQIVVLLQCAAGHNWAHKQPVPMGAWTQYVHWACPPVIGFSVPCVIDESSWHDQAVVKGVLLDRPRIVNSLSSGVEDGKLASELKAFVKSWIEDLDE